MDAGRLNQRITIKRRASGVDAVGQPVEMWDTVAETWADIRHPSGSQAVRGDADTSVVRASIRIRYRTGIDAGMVVAHGSATYDIRAVIPDSAGRVFTDLVCEART